MAKRALRIFIVEVGGNVAAFHTEADGLALHFFALGCALFVFFLHFAP
jgi:hypothetical protein